MQMQVVISEKEFQRLHNAIADVLIPSLDKMGFDVVQRVDSKKIEGNALHGLMTSILRHAIMAQMTD